MTIQIKILKNGVQTHGATSAQFENMEAFEAWKQQCIESNVWGKPERWVTDSLLAPLSEEEKATALESRSVEQLGQLVTEYLLPAEYSVEVSDVSVEIAQEKTNQEALAYLASTDWYVTRFIESGVAIPQEVSQLRAEARGKIIKGGR